MLLRGAAEPTTPVLCCTLKRISLLYSFQALLGESYSQIAPDNSLPLGSMRYICLNILICRHIHLFNYDAPMTPQVFEALL